MIFCLLQLFSFYTTLHWFALGVNSLPPELVGTFMKANFYESQLCLKSNENAFSAVIMLILFLLSISSLLHWLLDLCSKSLIHSSYHKTAGILVNVPLSPYLVTTAKFQCTKVAGNHKEWQKPQMMSAEKNTAEGHAIIYCPKIHFAREMCNCKAKAVCVYSWRLATSGDSATSPLHWPLHKHM